MHDLIITAGIYAWVGFEVTPSTVVGLLTILGFSLYDTVVVFDKVAENTKDLTAGSRMTYSEAANLAVNQTLMRSINTSLISLLPVAGLLFVGAGLLGVGTIKDLALILFVGLAAGAYSSLFLATPIVCSLTERQPEYQALASRVAAKRASERARQAELAAHPELAAAIAGDRRGAPAPAPKPAPAPRLRRGHAGAARRDAASARRAHPQAHPMTDALGQAIAARLRDVPDFPEPGILFKDISPLLADSGRHAGSCAGAGRAGSGAGRRRSGCRSRGARLLLRGGRRRTSCGAVWSPVRKAGKLPPPTVRAEYELEYGSAEIEVPVGILDGHRVLLVDDVLATGGTVSAAADLLEKAGAEVAGIGVVVELAFLGGRARLAPRPLEALLTVGKPPTGA